MYTALLFVSSMRLTPLGLTRSFSPGETFSFLQASPRNNLTIYERASRTDLFDPLSFHYLYYHLTWLEMNIITWNVNGIRAVERKGEIQNLVTREQPDILMIQEIKGTADQFSKFLTCHDDYTQYYSSAEKKGYAGTSIWIRRELEQSVTGLTFNTEIPKAPNADEGRISNLSFEKEGDQWELFSIYFPNGGKSELAWQEKLVFYDCIHDHMNTLRKKGRIVLVGGDMNVAHTEIDIARPKENDGKIGFHPKERAWMDRLDQDGWTDVWRKCNPGVTDVYSWWHMISRGRERNVGWRIDYFLMNNSNLDRVNDVGYLNDQMGSDHCPMWIKLK